jgi:hypothetical protein
MKRADSEDTVDKAEELADSFVPKPGVILRLPYSGVFGEHRLNELCSTYRKSKSFSGVWVHTSDTYVLNKLINWNFLNGDAIIFDVNYLHSFKNYILSAKPFTKEQTQAVTLSCALTTGDYNMLEKPEDVLGTLFYDIGYDNILLTGLYPQEKKELTPSKLRLTDRFIQRMNAHSKLFRVYTINEPLEAGRIPTPRASTTGFTSYTREEVKPKKIMPSVNIEK